MICIIQLCFCLLWKGDGESIEDDDSVVGWGMGAKINLDSEMITESKQDDCEG